MADLRPQVLATRKAKQGHGPVPPSRRFCVLQETKTLVVSDTRLGFEISGNAGRTEKNIRNRRGIERSFPAALMGQVKVCRQFHSPQSK